MKKRTLIFYILVSVITAVFLSCKVDVADKSLLIKPDIDLTSKQATLIIHKISNETSYINVYRQTIDDSLENNPVYNIGVIYPKTVDSNEQTYRFIDKLVNVDSVYRYRARYFDSDGYHYTDWSNSITIESDFEEAYPKSTALYYKASDSIGFTFEDTNYTLKLSGALTLPSIRSFSDYQPMLIVSNGLSTQVFKIPPESLTQREIITLKDRLPVEFLDRTIVIIGVLAQKTEYTNPEAAAADRIIKSIHWTAPTSIKVNGYSDNAILIPSSKANSGLDYTSSAK